MQRGSKTCLPAPSTFGAKFEAQRHVVVHVEETSLDVPTIPNFAGIHMSYCKCIMFFPTSDIELAIPEIFRDVEDNVAAYIEQS